MLVASYLHTDCTRQSNHLLPRCHQGNTKQVRHTISRKKLPILGNVLPWAYRYLQCRLGSILCQARHANQYPLIAHDDEERGITQTEDCLACLRGDTFAAVPYELAFVYFHSSAAWSNELFVLCTHSQTCQTRAHTHTRATKHNKKTQTTHTYTARFPIYPGLWLKQERALGLDRSN